MSTDIEGTVSALAQSLGRPTVNRLVSELVSQKGVKFNDAARVVYVMWKQGRLELEDPSPPTSFIGYARSAEGLWLWAVLAVVLATIPTVLFVTGSPLIYLRYALGALFVLYLPGSMLIEALYIKRGELEGLEKVALSLGLSLAVVPLIGLVLNFTPLGIRLEPIVISLALFTLTMAFTAAYRQYRRIRSFK